MERRRRASPPTGARVCAKLGAEEHLPLWMLCLLACPRPLPPPDVPFAWEARLPRGDVRVLPALGVFEPPLLDLRSWLDAPLPEPRRRLREQRTRELGAIPSAVGLALPGALNAHLGTSWPGDFREAAWSAGSRGRLEGALRKEAGVDPALGEVGREVGQPVLVTWVDRLAARPLSLDGFPGDVVQTPAGPVIVDHAEEAYLVDLRVGVALVSGEGELLLKVQDDLVAVLSGGDGPGRVGRDVAARLADDIMKVWSRSP